MVHVIQSEWIFKQCMKNDTVHAFTRVEKLLQETFLPRLIFGKPKSLPPIVGTLSTMPVNKSIPGLKEPVTSDKKIPKFDAWDQRADWGRNGSKRIFSHRLPSGAQGRKSWRTKIRDNANNAKLKGLVEDLEAPDRCLILRAKSTGSCLTLWCNTATVTVVMAAEFLVFCMHVMMLPPLTFKNVTASLNPSPYLTYLCKVTY